MVLGGPVLLRMPPRTAARCMVAQLICVDALTPEKAEGASDDRAGLLMVAAGYDAAGAGPGQMYAQLADALVDAGRGGFVSWGADR